MAQQVDQEFSQDFLHCYICMNRFKKPLMLPCLHSFCFHCLKKYETKVQKDKFSCPICRRPVELSEEGVEGLPSNNFLSNLIGRLDLVEKLKKEKSSKCNFCRRNVSPLVCLDCQLRICSSCKKEHTRVPGTGDHIIITAEKLNDEEYLKKMTSKVTPQCEEHKKEKLRFYCRKCFQLICRDCQVVVHQGHECVKAESETLSAKERLEDLLEDSKEECQGGRELFENLETSVKSLEAQATKLLELVDSQYDKCIEKLKSDREALRNKIQTIKGNKCRTREKSKGEISNVLQAMGNIQDVTRRILQRNNVWEILRMEKVILRSFEKIEDDLDSVCEEGSSDEDYDIDSSSDANSSSDNGDQESDSSSSGSDTNVRGEQRGDKKSDNGVRNPGNVISDDEANIGIKFVPSKIKPSDISDLEVVGRPKSNWRNKNHVGRIVRS